MNDPILNKHEADETESSGIDAQRLCDAATAVFFAIVRCHSARDGRPLPVPLLLCPKSIPKCPCEFTRHEVIEAEKFLLRIGYIERRRESDMPLINLQ